VNETPFNCPQDCRTSMYCGNGSCDSNETPYSCPNDCSFTRCGNGYCEPGENGSTCPIDCPYVGYCGNGSCEPGEYPGSCPQDCGMGVYCGNGSCDFGLDREDILEFTIERSRPEFASVRGLNQFSNDSHLIALFAHCPFQ